MNCDSCVCSTLSFHRTEMYHCNLVLKKKRRNGGNISPSHFLTTGTTFPTWTTPISPLYLLTILSSPFSPTTTTTIHTAFSPSPAGREEAPHRERHRQHRVSGGRSRGHGSFLTLLHQVPVYTYPFFTRQSSVYCEIVVGCVVSICGGNRYIIIPILCTQDLYPLCILLSFLTLRVPLYFLFNSLYLQILFSLLASLSLHLCTSITLPLPYVFFFSPLSLPPLFSILSHSSPLFPSPQHHPHPLLHPSTLIRTQKPRVGPLRLPNSLRCKFTPPSSSG